MSGVVLQVGQCGNQIGQHVWETVLKNNDRNNHVFCHFDGKLRSVNVDSEPKVVRTLLKNCKSGKFREGNIILGKRGKGSNWALGYSGSIDNSDVVIQDTMDAHRRETERCDSYSGTIIIHSLSGGTGSGVGSRLCELLRDEYPLAYQLSVCVAPHSTGESPLQHYNCLLCLARLQRYADGIIWFDNDEVMNRLLKATRAPPGGFSNVTLNAMNHHISSALCGVLCPIDSLTPKTGVSLGMEPWELIRSVCPMPANKFIHVNHVSERKSSWIDIAKNATNFLQQRNQDGQHYTSLSNVIVSRGDPTGSFPSHINAIEERIKKCYNTVSWNPYPCDFWIGKRSLSKTDKPSLTIASNYSSVIDLLQRVVNRSQEMYNAGAYLHWYQKYGCDKEYFECAFESVNNVIASYQESILS